MKKVIINADDFGLTCGVNKGIIECYQAGIVTNVSLFTNMPGYEDAIRLVNQNPNLGVGIHLNITCGTPISSKDKVPTLVNKEGYFFKWYQLIKRLLLNQIDLNQIKLELKAQIEKLMSNGIKPIHIDSHQYIHAYPEVFKIVIDFSKEYNIFKVRYPYERFNFNRLFFSKQNFKRTSLFLLLRLYTPKRVLIKNGIITPDNFLGIMYTNTKYPLLAFENMLRSVKEGTNEIVCHPGYVDDELIKLTPYIHYVHPRKNELETILHPRIKELIKELDIKLISYKGIG